MNQDIQNQIQLMMGVDQVNPNDAVIIMQEVSKIIASQALMDKIIEKLKSLFSTPNFDIFTDMAQVLVTMIEIASQTKSTDAKIEITHMKYIIFAQIYKFLLDNPEIIKTVDIGQFRLIYNNAFTLLSVIPATIKISKKKLKHIILGCCGLYDAIDV